MNIHDLEPSKQQWGYIEKWMPEKKEVALDLGCGERKLADWLIGVDRFNGTLIGNTGNTRTIKPDVLCDITTLLSFENNSVDFMISAHSLEHLVEPLKALKIWIKKLKIGGRLIVVVPDWRYTYSCKAKNQLEPGGHRFDFTPDILKDKFELLDNVKILDVSEARKNFSVGGVLERIS